MHAQLAHATHEYYFKTSYGSFQIGKTIGKISTGSSRTDEDLIACCKWEESFDLFCRLVDIDNSLVLISVPFPSFSLLLPCTHLRCTSYHRTALAPLHCMPGHLLHSSSLSFLSFLSPSLSLLPSSLLPLHSLTHCYCACTTFTPLPHLLSFPPFSFTTPALQPLLHCPPLRYHTYSNTAFLTPRRPLALIAHSNCLFALAPHFHILHSPIHSLTALSLLVLFL